MASITAFGASTLPVQQWTTVLWKGKTILMAVAPTSKRGNTLKKSIAEEHQGQAKEPSKIESWILFPHASVAPPKDQRYTLNITHQLNIALSTAEIPTHIHIYRFNFNEKGSLSDLIEPASTSSLLLSQHRELILGPARKLEKNITDTTGDQRWHRIRVHRVELSQYGQEGGIKLIHDKILYGGYNI